MQRWTEHVLALAADGPVVMVTVIATEGSTPRDVGARMLVGGGRLVGSVGGGRLEFDATARARDLLARHGELGPWHRQVRRVVLGPDAGQCCGGVAELLHEVFGPAEVAALCAMSRRTNGYKITRPLTSGTPLQFVIPAKAWAEERGGDLDVRLSSGLCTSDEGRCWTELLALSLPKLYLYGAGHTAREVVRIAEGLPLDIVWIDVAADRFPPGGLASVERVVSAQPANVATAAAADALHLVMTHSHDIDYAICEALLTRDAFAFLGLIGSATKRARFLQRFRRSGILETAVARLVCPIGLDAIVGKTPAVVALSAVAQLVAVVPALRV